MSNVAEQSRKITKEQSIQKPTRNAAKTAASVDGFGRLLWPDAEYRSSDQQADQFVSRRLWTREEDAFAPQVERRLWTSPDRANEPQVIRRLWQSCEE